MYITLDIGGSKGRIALFASLDKKSLINIVYLSIQDDFENDIKKIFTSINSLRKGKHITAMAIGIAGSVDEKGTGIMNSGNLKTWEDSDLVKLFNKEFGCDVMVANDTFMAGFAEGLYGDIKEDFLYINWGTGIGGCLVNFFVDKEFEIRPTELGHQIIVDNGVDCNCGQKGCLDAYVGGKGIENIYKNKAVDISPYQWQEVARRFAIGIINSVVVYPVKYIVLGGGIAINQPYQIKELEKYIKKELKIIKAPLIRLASLRDHAALYGGLALLQKHDIE
jgi:glucokinase